MFEKHTKKEKKKKNHHQKTLQIAYQILPEASVQITHKILKLSSLAMMF